MANLNNVDIPVGVNKHTKLDLSCDHVTTLNFCQPQVVFYRHMIPGESLDCSVLGTVRPFTMVVPTYGRMRVNLRAFAVPYNRIMPQWDSFYTDTLGTSYQDGTSIVNSVPQFNLSEWITMILWPQYSVPVSDQVNDPYDFFNGSLRYALTPLGRHAVKVMHSLGYRLPYESKNYAPINALGLLSFYRVYYDWYANQQYLDSSVMLRLKALFAYNSPLVPLQLLANDLNQLFQLSFSTVYDTDNYFNSAWDNPTSPNGSQFSAVTFTDVTWPNDTAHTVTNLSANGTPYMTRGTSAPANSLGTQYIHDMLKALTNYEKRHQLSGALQVERYLAEYGFASQYLKSQRSTYVGMKTFDVNVGDIMSTANTSPSGTPSNLGDYAGRGFGQSSQSWKYSTDEFCVFLVIATMQPSCGFYQGFDRHNLDLNVFDFYHPDYDALGCQSIMKGEVFVSNDGSNFAPSIEDYFGTFGFCGRYGHYKRPLSNVTGDFEFNSVMQGGDSWHLMRQFTEGSFNNSVANVGHSLNFSRAEDYEEYNRIFAAKQESNDYFFANFHFDVASLAPCRPLFETYDFDMDSDKVRIQSNGATLN